MSKDWKYIIYLTLIIGVFVIIKLMSPKQYDWSVTLAHEDKNPYGTYALHELLAKFASAPVQSNYKTLYELKDSIGERDNIVIIATRFNAQKEDVEVLLEKVHSGATAFIASNYFSGNLADSLGIAAFTDLSQQEVLVQDTATLYLTYQEADSTLYPYLRQNILNYLGRVDSVKATVLARNEWDKPVAVKINHGKGALILNTTPLAFTNIHLLSNNNHGFAAGLLSFLPSGKVWRTEYYHVGRREAGSPLRFILQSEPLRWAYYLLLISLLVFILAEVKRKQRIIPVITPLANSTLEFVSTIGNLYFQKSDHRNIAEKKILFFLEQVRNHYFLSTTKRDEHFIDLLSRKSGHDPKVVAELVRQINAVSVGNNVSSQDLIKLNSQIEKFWRKP